MIKNNIIFFINVIYEIHIVFRNLITYYLINYNIFFINNKGIMTNQSNFLIQILIHQTQIIKYKYYIRE